MWYSASWGGYVREWAAQREWVYPCTNATAATLPLTCSFDSGRHRIAPPDPPPPPSSPQWDQFVAQDLLPSLFSVTHPRTNLPNYTSTLAPMTPAEVEARAPVQCGHAEVSFSGADGSIEYLKDMRSGRVWVGGERGNGTQRLAQFHYRSFSQDDCATFGKEYGGTGRPGYLVMNISTGGQAMSKKWRPKLLRGYEKILHTGQEDGAGSSCKFVMQLGMADMVSHVAYGAPLGVSLEYVMPGTDGALADINLVWTNKTATELPEAMWLSFVPEVAENDQSASWAMDVMGHPVDPREVVAGGTTHVHAVQDTVTLRSEGQTLTVTTVDTPVVSPGDADHLMRYVDEMPDVRGGMHFVLQSNLWATAFPQFYAYDGLARFHIH